MLLGAVSLFVALAVGKARAHGGVQSYLVNGVDFYQGFKTYTPPEEQTTIARPWYSIDPLIGVDTPILACNNHGEAMPEGGQVSAHVKAGDTIQANWGFWIHPFGPVIVYMARCPGACTEANSTQLRWFKISEQGLISGNLIEGVWGSGNVVATGVYDVVIPSALADGEYLIRHELISLHLEETGAQFYPQCAQVVVSGGEGRLPPESYLVAFPGAYKKDDPGLNIDLYGPGAVNVTHYEVPGPRVWNGQEE